MKVVHVIHDLRAGGTERRMLAVLAALDRARFEPLLCCVDGLGELEPEARALGLDPIVLGRRRRRDVSGVARLARFIRSERADIVHGWLFLANVFGRLGGRLGGAPVVVAGEGGAITTMDKRRAALHGSVERVLAGLTDAVVANSGAVAEMLRKVGIPERKLVVIRNGVAIPAPLGDAERVRLRNDLGGTGRRLVGMVARLDPDFKDHETLLRAVAEIRQTRSDVGLVIVGDGPARPYLERLASELGVPTSFTGYRADARELLGALDVSVLLSYSEGFSNVVLEAMAAGVPLVATDLAANREALEPGIDGLLVPLRDVAATAHGIARLLDEPAFATALGERARARAASQFSLERQGAETMELYERLVAAKSGR